MTFAERRQDSIRLFRIYNWAGTGAEGDSSSAGGGLESGNSLANQTLCCSEVLPFEEVPYIEVP